MSRTERTWAAIRVEVHSRWTNQQSPRHPDGRRCSLVSQEFVPYFALSFTTDPLRLLSSRRFNSSPRRAAVRQKTGSDVGLVCLCEHRASRYGFGGMSEASSHERRKLTGQILQSCGRKPSNSFFKMASSILRSSSLPIGEATFGVFWSVNSGTPARILSHHLGEPASKQH